AARGGRFLPSVTHAPIGFGAGQESIWVSPWGQAATLLQEIAKFPRRVLTDGFFLRGLDIAVDELCAAMDVCGDAIVAAFRTRGVKDRARADLALLDRLAASKLEARRRCELLLALMAGEDIEGQIPSPGRT